MTRLLAAGSYSESVAELCHENPDIRPMILERILLFRKNPDDTRLRNHKLTGKLSGRWAFSITDDIRVVYEWIGKTTVRLLAIGTDEAVYPKKRS